MEKFLFLILDNEYLLMFLYNVFDVYENIFNLGIVIFSKFLFY